MVSMIIPEIVHFSAMSTYSMEEHRINIYFSFVITSGNVLKDLFFDVQKFIKNIPSEEVRLFNPIDHIEIDHPT